jgi:hypothetical protein
VFLLARSSAMKSDWYEYYLYLLENSCIGALGLRVYRVVGPCVGRGPSPRLYNCNPSLGIN